MMERKEQIPAEIYDLLQQKTFTQLDASQQALVQQWMSAEAYDLLRELERDAMTSLSKDGTMELPDTRVPEALRTAFRNKYRQPPAQKGLQGFMQRTIPVWQVAAAFLLIIAGGAFLLMQRTADGGFVSLPVHDTVFLAVNDTIYLGPENDRGFSQKISPQPARNQVKQDRTELYPENPGLPPVGDEHLQLLHPGQRNDPLNMTAVRNMGEDSLVGQIGFSRF